MNYNNVSSVYASVFYRASNVVNDV